MSIAFKAMQDKTLASFFCLYTLAQIDKTQSNPAQTLIGEILKNKDDY